LGASVVMKGVVTEILNTVYCMQKYEAMYGMYVRMGMEKRAINGLIEPSTISVHSIGRFFTFRS